MLGTGGLVAGGHIKFVFMPEISSDWVTISVNMPQGTTAAQTANVVQYVEQQALALRDQIDAESEGEDSIYRNVFYLHRRPTHGPACLPPVNGFECRRPRTPRRSYH